MNIKNILNVVLLFVLSLGMAGCSDSDGDGGGKTDAPVAAMMPQRSNPMGVYAHYMPWFELIRPISMQESGVGTGQ